MTIEFDPEKDVLNIAKHGVSLSRAADLEILAYVEDERNAYGEVRYRACLRRAHKKEMIRYAP